MNYSKLSLVNKYKFLADLKIDSEPMLKLANSLKRIELGSKEALFTPLGKEHKPLDILNDWNVIFNKNSSIINKELMEIETSERGKYGPRSISLPWLERKMSVYNYFEGSDLTDLTINCEPQFSKDKSKLRPVSYEKALSFIRKSTSSGLPFITSKGLALDMSRKDIVRYLDRLDPALMGTRTQEMGKTRTFWIVALADILFEMRFYQPLLEYQKKQSWRAALRGPEMVDQVISDMLLNNSDRDVTYISSDFVQFDATAKENSHKLAFKYFKSLYQSSYHDDIDKIQNRFSRMGLVTPDGIREGSHGIPSGSVFTNEVGSTVQMLIARQSKVVFLENLQCQGDDGVYMVNRGNVDTLKSTFTTNGLVLSGSDKFKVSSTSINYLRKYYSYDYDINGKIGGIYSVYRALNRLVHPERWINFEDFKILGKDYYSIRAISILENCKHHPLFEELVKFILSLDKYKLEYSEIGIKQYVQMLKDASGTSEIIKNQYGDEITGINNFETVKLIKRLVR